MLETLVPVALALVLVLGGILHVNYFASFKSVSHTITILPGAREVHEMISKKESMSRYV